MAELEDTIESNAKGPKQANVDGINTQQHSLADQIAADKYLASRAVAVNPIGALTRIKIVPPGAV